MQITFSPIRGGEKIDISRKQAAIIINGEIFNFAELPEGAELPAEATGSDWFLGPIKRIGGVLHVTLALPHGVSAPHETLFPKPITVTSDGPISVPAYEEVKANED